MAQIENERRKYPRVKGRFVISYRIYERDDKTDISQTKDISLGGAYITTNRKFAPGIKLLLELRLPVEREPARIIAKVIESREVTANLIYETRIQFLSVDEKHKEGIKQTVEYFMKRGDLR
ncbi:MAG: PilZ domain-containing protein [Candidatus Omnitrophica bacterium]|nr:PilZ domain-containing protein [Candidatus Omnitrophota bacterium]